MRNVIKISNAVVPAFSASERQIVSDKLQGLESPQVFEITTFSSTLWIEILRSIHVEYKTMLPMLKIIDAGKIVGMYSMVRIERYILIGNASRVAKKCCSF